MRIPYSKIRYYLQFFYYKIRIFIDCRSGKKSLYFAELLHFINAVFHTAYEMPHHKNVGTIETLFGKFNFIADNYGYSILSPAFERPDIEEFIRMLKDVLAKHKKVLFLDIGANVGLYTVGIARTISGNAITTIAVEPDPVYYRLLCENLKTNTVRHVTPYNVALGDINKTMRARNFILKGEKVLNENAMYHVKRLDSLISPSYYRKFDEIFIKIDIEGHEENAMDGAKKLWESGKKIHLMIEDCVNPGIVRYLTKNGWNLIKKITPYDSFWELH